jgi:hypothetical protein
MMLGIAKLQFGAGTMALCALLTFGPSWQQPLAAQTLDLSGAPTGPAIPETCGAMDLGQALAVEAATLSQEATKLTAEARDALEARARLRALAAHLLSNGARRPWPESAPVVFGMRIQGMLRRVDALLEQTLQGKNLRENRPLRTEESRRAVELLQELAAINTDRVRSACAARPDDLFAQLTVALATTLAPLVELTALVEGETLESPWPIVLDVRAPSLRAAERTASLAEVERRAQALAPGVGADAARRTLDALAQHLRAASHESDRRMLQDTLDAFAWNAAERAAKPPALALEALHAADRALSARLDALTAVIANPTDEPRQALATSLRIHHAAEMIISFRATLDPAQADRSTLSRVAERLLGDGLSANAGEQLRGYVRAADRITDACEAAQNLAVARTLPPLKDLKDQTRELDRKAPAALQALPKAFAALLEAVATHASAASDTALIAPLDRVASLARDRERIATLQRLVDTVGGIRMKSAGGFGTQAKKLAKMLGSSLERSNAEKTIASLDAQAIACVPLPYEEDLKRKTPRALELSAGQASLLVEAAARTRIAWAEALARGEFQSMEVTSMTRVARLFQCLEDLDRVESPITRDSGDMLATWGGWASRRAALAPAAQDLTARAKLAAQSLLSSMEANAAQAASETFERDVAALERAIPVVRLAAQLEARINPLLLTPKESVAAALAPLVIAPDPDAYLVRERMRFAMIDRALLEAEFARRTGSVRYRDQLGDFVAGLAREVSRVAFGTQPTKPPQANPPESKGKPERK